jgi:starch synthase
MRILLNTTTRPVGFDYARVLYQAGSLCKLVSAFPRSHSSSLRKELGESAVFYDLWQMVFLAANRLAGSTRFSRALSHAAKAALDRATVKHLDGCDAAIFYSGAGLKTARACRERGILSVCQVHHTHVLEQERILQREAKECRLRYTPIYSPAQVRRQLQEFKEADVILCPSTSAAESFVRAGFDETKLAVVPHGVDLQSRSMPSRSNEIHSQRLRILFVGQLHYRKGLRYLAQALLNLPSEEVECRLVGPDFGLSGLGGTGPASRLIKLGSKKGADLEREYAEADVFVLPSVEEGFGLVVLEAMHAGLPVIITSAVGAKDFVADGIEGWVVPPNDSAALSQKIEWMRTHPAERKVMGRAAAARALSAGGWVASARSLIEVLSRKADERGMRKTSA